VLTPDERPAASGPPGEAYRAMHVASGPDTRHHSARRGVRLKRQEEVKTE
jgi:hypothetical protein